MTMWFWPVLLAFATADPSPFTLLDVESVDDRPVLRYRPLELADRPVRPVTWESPAPLGVKYGLVPVGPHVDSSLTFAWDPEHAALWVDADADRRLTRAERYELKAGPPLAVTATIAAPAGPAGPAVSVVRTLLFRPGLLGAGPRYAVRGALAGTLDLGGHVVKALLVDGNADGCFHAAGTDRVWLDLDGDGRFDPAAEQFPLGKPVAFGGTSYTVASDPWGRSVRAHPRDPRAGKVRLVLGLSPQGRVASLSANLVSDTGELVTVETLDRPVEAPVGRYHLAALTLELADEAEPGRVWTYSFSGGEAVTVTVAPGAEARAELLHGLALDVSLAVHDHAGPGDDVDVTPHLRLPSALYLANCTMKRGQDGQDSGRTAEIVLRSPAGLPLDRVVSGFS